MHACSCPCHSLWEQHRAVIERSQHPNKSHTHTHDHNLCFLCVTRRLCQQANKKHYTRAYSACRVLYPSLELQRLHVQLLPLLLYLWPHDGLGERCMTHFVGGGIGTAARVLQRQRQRLLRAAVAMQLWVLQSDALTVTWMVCQLGVTEGEVTELSVAAAETGHR